MERKTHTHTHTTSRHVKRYGSDNGIRIKRNEAATQMKMMTMKFTEILLFIENGSQMCMGISEYYK